MYNYQFDTKRFIAEVAKHEGIYRRDLDIDQTEKMQLWREVGQQVYKDWNKIDKAEIYDRLIEMQRRWRSLRDAYKREIRIRKANNGSRTRRQYLYYRQMKRILDPGQDDDDDDDAAGDGDDGEVNDDDMMSHTMVQSDDTCDVPNQSQTVKEELQNFDIVDNEVESDPLVQTSKPARKRARTIRPQKRDRRILPQFRRSENRIHVEPNIGTQQLVHERVPIAPDFDGEIESEKLFLLSFAPELSRLRPRVRMWARAQIANVMQEAVTMQCTSPPSTVNIATESIP